jgi:hypothetical protein
MTTLTLRHLCLTGPDKEPARVTFGHGLNVIYGASETGKSFIVEALDFMLGSSTELRDIPERVGYDRMFLGIEDGDGNTFTLERSASGGQFRWYEGLHFGVPKDVQAKVLAAKYNPTRRDNLSNFLLEKIGLSGKRIKRNAGGDTNNLSFRNLAHLCLISEGDIQKRESPIETGQFISKTPEMAVFKLLLTGVDDSAIEPVDRDRTEGLSRAAKAEVIAELITENRTKLTELVGEEDSAAELGEQLSKLDETLSRERMALSETEDAHRALAQKRSAIRRNVEFAESRRVEIDELIARFNLLDRHYGSDLARLEGVREAGTLLGALDKQTCPLCGALPESQRHDTECDGDVDHVVNAAEAEANKIKLLRAELQDSLAQLRAEASRFDEVTPRLFKELQDTDAELERISPTVSNQRAAYSEVFEKRSTVQGALNLLSAIEDLEVRKVAAETPPARREDKETSSGDLSTSTLDSFSTELESILKSWHFPDASRVYFDKASRDFVIAGKPRGARGKGMRAITHAAFTVGLLEFTRINELSHPGFVVLDTPLLAYREPEGDDDDLSGTDVQDKFYEYLSTLKDRQVIILENNDPPENIRKLSQTVFFSKNPYRGRYGFFPV